MIKSVVNQPRNTRRYIPHQGKRECARRVNQPDNYDNYHYRYRYPSMEFWNKDGSAISTSRFRRV